MTKVLVVEDEPLALERVVRFLKEGGYQSFETAQSVQEALQKLRSYKPDVLILDIKLPDGYGLQVAKEALLEEKPPAVIFTTAYQDYAVDAFKLNAVDYLLKPFTKEEFLSAMDKALSKREQNKQVVDNFLKKINYIIPVKMGTTVILLSPEDIYYIKAEAGEVEIRTKEGFYPLSKKLYELEEILKPYNFFKVHRSYLVNLNKVARLKSGEQSKYRIFFKDIEETIETSREGAKNLREFFDI
ncbi:LytR/AlgR family response regulator transcription factor [Thermocrinis sp.]